MSRLRAVVPALLGVTLGSTLLVSAADAQAPAPSGPAAASIAQARTAPMPPKSVWLAKVRKKLVGAKDYLDAHAKDAPHPALVLDIDNTSLQSHYGWPKPVKPTLRVAKRAVADGYTVFFVTGRTPAGARAAKPALTAAGYVYAGVYGRTKGAGLAISKQTNRELIVHRGYKIVMDIGNRKTDLSGKHVGHGIKLPSLDGRLS